MEDAPVSALAAATPAAPAPAPADPHPVISEIEHLGGEVVQFLVQHGPLIEAAAEAAITAVKAGGGAGPVILALAKVLAPALIPGL
jgi:hypothetical protein